GLYGNSGSTIMFPPVMRSRSLRFSGMAWTRTRTSPASGTGMATVSSWSASRGGPYSWVRHARIVPAVCEAVAIYDRTPPMSNDRFNCDRLVAEAVERSGADDFGEPTWQEGLDILV